ncbi:discoidin domain-containing receptor 2 isoform X1 [Polypterus senegalus]
MMLCFLLLLIPADVSSQIDPRHCRYALGMQDGTIKDDDLTASSQWYESTGPHYARLNRDEGDGAWCPAGLLQPSDVQFLQIDLGALYFVTLVGTQGRDARGNGNEFARIYRMDYSRDGERWMSWKDRSGKKVIQGNENPYEVVLKDLGPPIIAQYVRIIPVTEIPTTVCLRVEIYGCVWSDGLTSYEAPEGQTMAAPGYPSTYLNDSTYDGILERRWLHGGLGQLTDGLIGLDDFVQTHQYRVWPGYDYVGWRNDSFSEGYVELHFIFDRLRNFTSMKVHCNNMFTKGVKIFQQVSCVFKRQLVSNWEQEEVGITTILDDKNPSARFVTVPLGGQLGRAARCRFWFADTWMMLSEISFQCSADESRSKAAPVNTRLPSRLSTSAPAVGSTIGQSPSIPVKTTPPFVMSRPVERPSDSGTSILIGCLVAIILLLLVIIFLILWCQCVHGGVHKAPRRILEEGTTMWLSPCGSAFVTQDPPVPSRDAQTTSEYERIFPLTDEDPPLAPPAHVRKSTVKTANSGRRLKNVEPDLTQCTSRQASPRSTPHYAEPDLTQCTPRQGSQAGAPHYAETDIVSLQGVTGSNMYAIPALTVESLTRKEVSVGEFPRHFLRFREKLGEGQFGEVHLCEAVGLQQFLQGDSHLLDDNAQPVLVAVKKLQDNASRNAKNDFLKEVKIMSRLKDPNIISLLAVCITSDPLCMITEYMENGDLNQFLCQREMESTLTHANNIPSVSLTDLLHMAVQISSGMRYLASLNFVHRDLATRNCLVDHQLTIKIADFGMSRNLYSCDYYRIQGRAVLPIRWMAWESILLGKFTTASDVWAFGVTLWEIFTLCKEQPYSQLSDEQVIANTGSFFRNEGQQILLTSPPRCPQLLFELMLRCWSRDIKDRPSFEKVHRFLRDCAP